MKFVALVSGGKDSMYSIMECIRNGHELIGCVHMAAPNVVDKETDNDNDNNEEEEESFMYQTAGSEVIPTLVEQCLQVPLIWYQRKGKSINTSLVYDSTNELDEVEDLFLALQIAQTKFHGTIQAVCSGAILSTYQRLRIEHVCNRLALTSLSYLWRMGSQHEVLDKILQAGILAVLVRTACPPGLLPRRHLNKSLQTLRDSGLFQQLHDQYQFHVCGEGGEYETIVLDSPLFKKRLVLDEVEIIELEDDDGVGFLKIHKCHAEEKEPPKESMPTAIMTTIPPIPTTNICAQHVEDKPKDDDGDDKSKNSCNESNDASTKDNTIVALLPKIRYLPHVYQGSGGLLHLSEIMASSAAAKTTTTTTTTTRTSNTTAVPTNEAQLAVQEAMEIFSLLQSVLNQNDATAQDVVFVHLYLSEISHFATINAHYREFFGTLLPPSRSCVAIGKHRLPGGRRVLLDCMIQCGSGDYMRTSPSSSPTRESSLPNPYTVAALANSTSRLRQVLHVQSLSYWAPVCVGPYSQVNTIRSGLHFLAGQIGLIPCTMKLHSGWIPQLNQCWINVASVLDALDHGSLHQLLSGLVYVTNDVYTEQKSVQFQQIQSICHDQIQQNGGIVPGKIDGIGTNSQKESLYGGYEDEGTWLEMTQQEKNMDPNTTNRSNSSNNNVVPLLIVSLPELPVGALVEVEAIGITKDAASCLDTRNVHKAYMVHNDDNKNTTSNTRPWDTGHEFDPPLPTTAITTTNISNTIQVDAVARIVGNGCASSIVVTARHNTKSMHSQALSNKNNNDKCLSSSSILSTVDINCNHLLLEIFHCLDQVLATGRSQLDSRIHTVTVRLYYVTKEIMAINDNSDVDDGLRLRSSLQSVLATWQCNQPGRFVPAASTVVPVQGFTLTTTTTTTTATTTTTIANDDYDSSIPLLALHVLVMDPVHMETELWIRKQSRR